MMSLSPLCNRACASYRPLAVLARLYQPLIKQGPSYYTHM